MSISLLITLSLLSLLLTLTTAITFEQQLDATESALRSTGYNLFGNAISTSDLRYRLLSSSNSNSSFTIFAPLDSSLYSLDMSTPATSYTQTLYYHVVDGSHTISDLRNVFYLDTMLLHYSVLVNQNEVNDTVVDGVSIALPDLFVGSRIVVHGLDGILVPGEVAFDEPLRDSDFHPDLSPQALTDSDFFAPASFDSPVSSVSPAMSPVSFDSQAISFSPAMSPVSFDSPANSVSPVNGYSPAISPSQELHSPGTESESVVSARSSPSRSVRKDKNSKRKNRGKARRSKERRHHGHDKHRRFSKFIERHRSDF